MVVMFAFPGEAGDVLHLWLEGVHILLRGLVNVEDRPAGPAVVVIRRSDLNFILFWYLEGDIAAFLG